MLDPIARMSHLVQTNEEPPRYQGGVLQLLPMEKEILRRDRQALMSRDIDHVIL